MTPTPVPVPELDLGTPVRGAIRPLGPASVEPAWWVVFDPSRFPQPEAAAAHGPTRTTARPLPIPEFTPRSVSPWPAPRLPSGGIPSSTGWWFGVDGRWHPPEARQPPTADDRGMRSVGRHRALRTVGVAAVAAVAVAGGLMVVGLRSGPGPGGSAASRRTTPTTVPATTPAPPPRPSAVSTTTVPAGTASPAPTAGPTTVPATAPPTAPAPTAAPAPAPQASSGVVYQYESGTVPTTVGSLAADPAATAGRSVVFTGVIARFALDSSGGATAMYVSDPGAPSSVVLVQISVYDDVTQLNTGDTVVVWGDASGRVEYDDSVGEPTELTQVDEVYLADRTSGYEDTGDPSPA